MKKIRRVPTIITAGLTLFSLVFFYNNCADVKFAKLYGGSSLGNPMTSVSNEITFALCGVINRCNPQVSLQTCQMGLMATSGFSAPLGLSSNFDTLPSISQAESSGILVGNIPAGGQCFDSINNLTCADPTVAAAYNSSLQNPFSGTPNMIPSASCNQVFAPTTYANFIAADNPIAYWRLDEASGTTAFDFMNNYNGTYTPGAGLTLGVPGAIVGVSDTAASFTHAGPGNVNMTLPTINTAPGTFVTVEFWMKWSGANLDMMPFGFQGYDLLLWNSLTPNNTFGFNTGNGDIYGTSPSLISTLSNKWAHVVAVMVNMSTPSDMTQNKLYINSNLQTLSQLGTPLAMTTTTNFRISSWAQSSSSSFDGALDEFAIYNYALSQAQVTQHYNAGLGIFP